MSWYHHVLCCFPLQHGSSAADSSSSSSSGFVFGQNLADRATPSKQSSTEVEEEKVKSPKGKWWICWMGFICRERRLIWQKKILFIQINTFKSNEKGCHLAGSISRWKTVVFWFNKFYCSVLLSNTISHWLSTNLESALNSFPLTEPTSSPTQTLAESAAAHEAKKCKPELQEVQVLTGEENESNVFQVSGDLKHM